MDWDDLKPKPAKGITLGESLESLSVAELEARIVALHERSTRVSVELAAKKAHEAAAARSSSDEVEAQAEEAGGERCGSE